MNRDLYAILGVSKDAERQEIRQAYKALAMKWHPDKNQYDTETAKKQFQDISEAYSILSNPASKLKYDSNNHKQSSSRIPGSFSGRRTNFDNLYDSFTARTKIHILHMHIQVCL
jgi:molecular chaperone DnaJ